MYPYPINAINVLSPNNLISLVSFSIANLTIKYQGYCVPIYFHLNQPLHAYSPTNGVSSNTISYAVNDCFGLAIKSLV